ncbi:SMC-Scp complex subunit ScpB [Patescibacteria group bacterium]|nr:SMC-Scp complex subunit ScpB [Patescibacteria group bacterium]
MTDLAAKIESILFLSARPVSFRKLAKLLQVKESDIKSAVEDLAQRHNTPDSGIHLVVSEAAVEFGSNPDHTDLLATLSKEEIESELTRPQLETLTIIAYRGPITRPEIEHIRGVNCSIILRNLLMRGLIVEKEDSSRLQPVYSLSTEMLRFLGLHDVKELPDYKELHQNAKIDQLLESVFDEQEKS